MKGCQNVRAGFAYRRTIFFMFFLSMYVIVVAVVLSIVVLLVAKLRWVDPSLNQHFVT